MTTITISQVNTPEEMEAVARFRYSVYVEEMNRPQADADHARRMIMDSMDTDSIVLAAYDGSGQVVGTLRNNYVRNGNLGSYYNAYLLDQLTDDERYKAGVLTLLMTASPYRGSTLSIRLASRMTIIGLLDGLTTTYMDCNRHLIEFFTSLGFVMHRHSYLHPEYGDVCVMRLDALNLSHLHRLRSPLLPTVKRFLAENQANSMPHLTKGVAQ